MTEEDPDSGSDDDDGEVLLDEEQLNEIKQAKK